MIKTPRSFSLALGLALVLLGAGTSRGAEQSSAYHWYKGDIHAHSLWSDGNSFPESVVNWYKSRGFQFFALTDHNTLQEGQRWVEVAPKGKPGKKKRGVASQQSYAAYKKLLGPRWLDEQTSGGKQMVRLKTLAEYRARFEQPGKFLLIQAEEISCPTPKGTDYRVHVNGVNLASKIDPPIPGPEQEHAGVWQAETAAKLIAAQAEAQHLKVHAQLNHPFWSHLTTEDICRISSLNRMEINNDDSGSSESLPKTEAAWDAVLAYRLEHAMPLMFVTAVDDAHNHLTYSPFGAGHGWIMVRARSLATDEIITALNSGDFYATRGPVMTEINGGKAQMSLKIQRERGVTFKTEFVGQRKGGKPGEILATQAGLTPAYTLKGDELYVRAKVTSSKLKRTPDGKPAYFEMAWTQPYEPAKAK